MTRDLYALLGIPRDNGTAWRPTEMLPGEILVAHGEGKKLYPDRHPRIITMPVEVWERMLRDMLKGYRPPA